MDFDRFEHRSPSPQTAVDIFSGRWASDLSQVIAVESNGGADLFRSDPRPRWAAEAFGNEHGRLDGMRVLELGPLEGGHSYQLEQLGAAQVTAIDANVEAYIKCLIIKEALSLKRCKFMLGDALSYMESTADRFDVVFCSGLLYHMPDPVQLIKACCEVSNQVFVWTHYYDAESGNAEGERIPRDVSLDGFDATYHELGGAKQDTATYWGGSASVRAWMEKPQILDCFRHFGLDDIRIIEDSPSHANGPAMSFVASRQWSKLLVRVTMPPETVPRRP